MHRSVKKGRLLMKILVVVDMQNDFITGPLGSTDAQAMFQQ